MEPVGAVTNKGARVSKIRIAVAAVLTAFGLSCAGALVVPAVASADPWQPYSGPFHPVRHYLGDVEHPFWAINHPVRAATP
jgi:hypothetical protein